MPRRAEPNNRSRPQTLKEAARAYKATGKSRTFSASQIRRNERAVEADERAAGLLAKEKRAKEAKKKRLQREIQQKEERRKLVEQGKQPVESLWGKVRASQPRLHNFIAPKQGKAKTATGEPVDDGKSLDKDVKASSIVQSVEDFSNLERLPFSAPAAFESQQAPPMLEGKVTVEAETKPSESALEKAILNDDALLDQWDEDSTGPEWLLLSAPAALEPQTVSPLPALNPPCHATICDEGGSKALNRAEEQGEVNDAAWTPAQMDAQLAFSASQLFSGFVEDADVEAELNGPSLSAKLPKLPSCRPGIDNSEFQLQSPPRKRKADNPPPTTPQSFKKPRMVFARISPTMLHTQVQEKASIALSESPFRQGLSDMRTALGLANIPTASQLEAMFSSPNFEDDDGNSDKENIVLHPVCLERGGVISTTDSTKSLWVEACMGPQSPVGLSVKQKMSSNRLKSELQKDNKADDSAERSDEDSEDEFGDDQTDEILQLVSQAMKTPRAASQLAPESESTQARAVNLSAPQRRTCNQASPLRSQVRNLQSGSQESSYGLDGIADEDLVGLAQQFSGSEQLNNDPGPLMSMRSMFKSGRMIPWPLIPQPPTGEEDDEYGDLNFLDEADWV